MTWTEIGMFTVAVILVELIIVVPMVLIGVGLMKFLDWWEDQ